MKVEAKSIAFLLFPVSPFTLIISRYLKSNRYTFVKMVHPINTVDESSMREETPNEHNAMRQLEMIIHHEETRAVDAVGQHQATATAVEDPQDFISTMLNEQIQDNHDVANGQTHLQETHVHHQDAATAVEAIIGDVPATNRPDSTMNATFQDRSRPHDDNEPLSNKRRRTEITYQETTTPRTNTGNSMYGNEVHVQQQQEQPYLQQQVDVEQNNAVHEKAQEQQQIQMNNVANYRNTEGVMHQAQLLPQQALNHMVHRQQPQQKHQAQTAQVPVQMQQNVYIQPLPTMDQNQMQMNAAETVGRLNLPVFNYPQNGQSFSSVARQEQLGAVGNGNENNGPSQTSTNHMGHGKEGEDGALTRVSTPLAITGELADKNLPWNDTNWVSSGLSDMVRGAREQMNVLLQRRRVAEDELANAQIALEVAQQKVEMAHKNIKFTDDAIQRSTESLTDALLQEPTHWNAMYHKLLRYKEEHGTIDVKKIDETAKKPNVDEEKNGDEKDDNPEETSENGWTAAELAKLNSWISKVRLAAKKTGSNPDVIEPYKIIALNRLNFKWDPREVYWSDRLEEFKKYLAAQPADQKHKMPNRKTPLGIWCDGQVMVSFLCLLHFCQSMVFHNKVIHGIRRYRNMESSKLEPNPAI